MRDPIHSFDAPGIILSGGGARHRLPEIVRYLGGTQVLLVTDPGVVALGVADEVSRLLDQAGIPATRFTDVQPDPTDKNVEAGVMALEVSGANVIVALGGGSPIDTAKVISIVPSNPEPLPSFMGLHKIPNRGIPVVAVPTTAGTGSEATKVAVITDTSRQVKMMMLSRPLLPSAAVVDFELTMTMPKALTAAVGVDTFTHGLEAFVSRKANRLSDPMALSCLQLVAENLYPAWSEPDNRAAREGMMLAATQGGIAFSNSSVCLVHGMSRPLGAVFHIPHGLSNAVLLPEVTRFSIQGAPGRYADAARLIGCTDSPDDGEASRALVDWLEQLNEALEIPRLRDCPGVTREVFEAQLNKMASDALASGSPANNPSVPTEAEIRAIYNKAW